VAWASGGRGTGGGKSELVHYQIGSCLARALRKGSSLVLALAAKTKSAPVCLRIDKRRLFDYDVYICAVSGKSKE
jgi:hypothetical protein